MADKNYTSLDDLVKNLVDEVEEDEQKHEHPMTAAPHKEAEPLAVSKEHVAIEMPAEHEVSPEIAHVVEARKETPEVPKDVQKMGVQAHPTTPQFATLEKVELPISDEKVEEGLKQPVTSSWRWLSEFCMYLLKQAHMTLKIFHGKVIRVGMEK